VLERCVDLGLTSESPETFGQTKGGVGRPAPNTKGGVGRPAPNTKGGVGRPAPKMRPGFDRVIV
jgi:hypothetical protein